MIRLKVTKKQGFTLSLKNTFWGKPQIDPQAFLGLNIETNKEKMYLGTTTFEQPFPLSCYFTKIFEHLSVIATVCYFSVYILIGWDPTNM